MKINYLENMGKGGSNVEVRMIEFSDISKVGDNNLTGSGSLTRVKYSEEYSELNCIFYIINVPWASFERDQFAFATVLDIKEDKTQEYLSQLFDTQNFKKEYRSIFGNSWSTMYRGNVFYVQTDYNKMDKIGCCEITCTSSLSEDFFIRLCQIGEEGRAVLNNATEYPDPFMDEVLYAEVTIPLWKTNK